MAILLINIDSLKPNLALVKLGIYFSKQCKEEVFINTMPVGRIAEKMYASCLFTRNRERSAKLQNIAELGGTGWNLTSRLPEEIDIIQPHINWGFTTRGCIRNCAFCVVPQKEGGIKRVGDLMDLWDGKAAEIVLLDNNILALPDHFSLIIRQAQLTGVRLDFNQGLDCRLLTEYMMQLLRTIRIKELRFAFDHPRYKPAVEKTIALCKKYNMPKPFWYVLVGFDTTLQEDLDRLYYLRSMNQAVFVQKYNGRKDSLYIPLARWANQHHIFAKMSFEEFVMRTGGKKYPLLYREIFKK